MNITVGQWIGVAATAVLIGVPVGAILGVFVADSETGMIVGSIVVALLVAGAMIQQFEQRNNIALTNKAARQVLDE